jgi:hypothetical protein
VGNVCPGFEAGNALPRLPPDPRQRVLDLGIAKQIIKDLQLQRGISKII